MLKREIKEKPQKNALEEKEAFGLKAILDKVEFPIILFVRKYLFPLDVFVGFDKQYAYQTKNKGCDDGT